MRWNFPASESMRACTVDERAVTCPNASLLGYGTRKAKPGHLVVYRVGEDGTGRGRVLGRVAYAPALANPDGWPGCGEVKNHLLVLQLADDCSHAYLRWIDPAHVTRVERCPTAFPAWYFQATLPAADIVKRLAGYGTLSESYIRGVGNGNGPRDITAAQARTVGLPKSARED